MVNSNMPMEMSPEWKAITKCESKIEALEKTLERHGEMLVEDEDRYDKLESVLKKSLTEIGNYLDTNRFEYLIKELSGGEVMIIEPEEPEEYEDPFNEKPPELIYPERDFVPIKKPPEPVWSSRRLRDKQLKRHYSGKDKHELCLTCETIISRDLINEFQQDLDDLSPLIPYSYEPLHDLRKKWEARKV